MKKIFIIILLLLLLSCQRQQPADLIVYNATIYTVDSAFSVKQCMAVKDGRILATGTDEEIKAGYSSSDMLDAGGKTIFPGFIDAHCHFVGYGLGLAQVDLVGTRSFEEVLERVNRFAQTHKEGWIIGRGWDQNDWAVKEFPAKEKLDSLFPNTPVFLKRVDGHAALANQVALNSGGITGSTKINGGEIVLKSGKPTGILIDNAVDLVAAAIPQPSQQQVEEALLGAEKNCFAVGLTTVDDAGIMKSDVDAIDALQKAGKLRMRIYAMLSDSAPNYAYYLQKGPYKTDRLNVRSFKFYADGALGSRGACLLEDYSDKPQWKGFLLSSKEHFEKYARLLLEKGFQMNTHCIGDSGNRMIAGIYKNTAKSAARWRIEHAQVVSKSDLALFQSIIPSVQPTHATSDMYWAEERLGKERMKYAYAYKELLKGAGMIALGTDFPVEDISPFKTFYAAVFRKDAKGYPEGGFQMENALSREETIKGMTLWAAYANFEEKEKGSLEPGKFADFVILDTDLMKCPENKVPGTKVVYTFLNGEMVYRRK